MQRQASRDDTESQQTAMRSKAARVFDFNKPKVLFIRLGGLRQVQGADALLANGVVEDVELPPKLNRSVTIEDFNQGLLMEVAKWAMEEAGPHGAVRFDDGGNPRGVATRGHRRELAELRSEMADDPTEFLRAFHDKAAGNIVQVVLNKELDLLLKHGNFLRLERHRALAFYGPAPTRTVERFRRDIGRKEGDGIQTQMSGCCDRAAKVGAIRLLHRRAPSNHNLGPNLP